MRKTPQREIDEYARRMAASLLENALNGPETVENLMERNISKENAQRIEKSLWKIIERMKQ